MWTALSVANLITCDPFPPSAATFLSRSPRVAFRAMEENSPQAQPKPNYEPRFMLSGHTMSISSVKFSPDGATLASAGEFRSQAVSIHTSVIVVLLV